MKIAPYAAKVYIETRSPYSLLALTAERREASKPYTSKLMAIAPAKAEYFARYWRLVTKTDSTEPGVCVTKAPTASSGRKGPPKNVRMMREMVRATAPAPTPRRNLLSLGLIYFHASLPKGMTLWRRLPRSRDGVNINDFSTFLPRLRCREALSEWKGAGKPL
jgi:hypothetical protein